MKTIPALIAAALFAAPSFAADVGVSISIGEPGFYGRIDLGDAPRPRLLYAEPMLIVEAPSQVVLQPVYLRVPANHASHWREHCGSYNACNQRVYFVADDWYNNDYAPHYRKKHGKAGKGYDKGKGHDKGRKHND